ncbi:HlyD family efflux transporter periplasmic adaptor subunit [Sinomicrobium pectinilyticum]|uniref:HlyD family efflux transporter periplasmic adaptor subunit n=1 Tax=Sinomicrobium pectinilyticum TaxID=1084421 RepID=A0A3N0DIS6_SINP1|nr:HlyD family efflux transporter periplasmic adaptor subunit [Sinomicrobium pectinilyticum]RNL75296.1 HlyD family efflux transporter periplasmic adaptor subunit [Sinomicrobium pectinilyticum]
MYKNLIICLAGLLGFSCGQRKEKVFPERMLLTESVYSSVTIQPDSLYQIYSAVGGILDYNLVEEGDPVNKEDPLVQIINLTPELNRENARLALELARENYKGRAAVLDEIRDEIAAASMNYRNDSLNYIRQKNLWEQKIGSKMEFDTRKLAYQLSGNTLSLLRNKYYRTKNELETRLKQAENNYKTSQIAATDFTVKSKIDGTVYALYKNAGETVSLQEPLGAVGCTHSFVIEMLIDEVDIVKIKKEQKVLVTLDAYGTEVFEAVVHKIYPEKDERSQTFKVEALFTKQPPVLYPGLSGEGNIIIARKEDALTIPKVFLSADDKVLTENGLVKVATGLQNLDRVEILQGIDEKTPLLKPEP